ncbi:MAG: hypothetical protein V4456_16505 [Bacteroidota bacterium]
MTTTEQTLEDIAAAKQAIDQASQDPEITVALQAILDHTANALQKLEDEIVLSTEVALVVALGEKNQELTTLCTEIGRLTKEMDHITDIVRKVGDTLGAVVTVLAAVVSTGVV